jgi:hypothetical protein
MILRAMEESLPWSRVQQFLEQFLQACARSDCERVRQLLMEAVDGYKPANGVDDLVWQAGRSLAAGTPVPAAGAPATVTDLAARRAAGSGTIGA